MTKADRDTWVNPDSPDWRPDVELPPGKLQYSFGGQTNTDAFQASATSISKAVRAFRVGCLCPDRLASVWLWRDGWDYPVEVQKSPSEGGRITVNVWTPTGGWHIVARIDVEGAESDFTPEMLPLAARTMLQVGIGPESDTTAVQRSSGSAITTGSRRELDQHYTGLQAKLLELERMKSKLYLEVTRIQEELKRRVEMVWVIELFVGSKEEVTVLRQGAPAPMGTPITLRQQILCMDEEIAVYDWMNHPERIGQFDSSSLEDFDAWLLADPAHLDQILPDPKGIVGLRVRRVEKDRPELTGMGGALQKAKLAQWDAMTYILVRNGENLYRLWVDVQLFPRLFPSVADMEATHYDPEAHRGRTLSERFRSGASSSQWAADAAKAKMKHFLAGMVAVQGIIERSELLHPLPPGISVFDPAAKGFHLLRDDEGHALLTDGSELSRLTWPLYRKWLHAQIEPGVRAMYIGPHGWADPKDIYRRTNMQSVRVWPTFGEVYTVEEGDPFSIMYAPDQVWDADTGDLRERKRRVRFYTYATELLPVDFISWRVLEHLIKDRSQRPEYGSFFLPAFYWWRAAKEQAERERPFVDLILRQFGTDIEDERERARAERLLRWWKVKVKEHRVLETDEAKALRMVGKAFAAGEDFDDDPEKALLRSMKGTV